MYHALRATFQEILYLRDTPAPCGESLAHLPKTSILLYHLDYFNNNPEGQRGSCFLEMTLYLCAKHHGGKNAAFALGLASWVLWVSYLA
jgi:hypothetical protein